MFEQSLELLLRIPKRFNAFQVKEWFSFLLRINCVIFARAINATLRWLPRVFLRLNSARYHCLPGVSINRVCENDAITLRRNENHSGT